MLFEGGFTFANFLADVLAVFLFVVWFWLLIIVFGDLFRRRDISGWAKALWVIALLVSHTLACSCTWSPKEQGWRSGPGSRLSRHARNSGRLWASVSPMRSRSLADSNNPGRSPTKNSHDSAPSWLGRRTEPGDMPEPELGRQAPRLAGATARTCPSGCRTTPLPPSAERRS